jgi:DNA-binding response OmpR family regulator
MAKVLIVDDEEVARVTLAEILQLEGYSIKAVSSGEAAVDILGKETFDIMILDLKMPGMGGLEVLSNMVDSQKDLSVIIMTAFGNIDSAIQAIRYRVQDYLLKPVSPNQILESIQRALINKQSAASSQVEEKTVYTGRVEITPGGAVLAWEKRQISWNSGSLSLTPTEGKLLKILFERRNEMVPHSELVFLIQGYRIETEEAAKILRPVVSRLRQKLTSVPEWNDRIKNVRGAGYVLEWN